MSDLCCKPFVSKEVSTVIVSIPDVSAHVAKKTKAVGAMSALSEGEIIAVTKMMYRAATHGQLEMVMKLLSQSPGEKHLVEEAKAKVGAMSDATKRRRDEEPFSAADLDPDVAFEIWHQELASNFGVDWECISQMSGGSEDFHVATPKGYTSVNAPKAAPKSRYGFAKTETVPNKYKPDDMPTAKDWSTTLCKLPKVLHLKLSYGELVELAETDVEIRDYLVWVIGSFGAKDGKLPMTMKGGADLALFLQYIDWTPIVKPSGGSTFKRELKKWSLSPRRRSMVTISSGYCNDPSMPPTEGVKIWWTKGFTQLSWDSLMDGVRGISGQMKGPWAGHDLCPNRYGSLKEKGSVAWSHSGRWHIFYHTGWLPYQIYNIIYMDCKCVYISV